MKKKRAGTEPPVVANALRIATLAAEKKAKDIRAFNLEGLTLITDCFVLCTATSEPQMKAVCNSILEGMKKIGVSPLHIEGNHRSDWLLLDYGDIIVHVFREEAREFYDLEGLWGDAPEIALRLT
ncbi:MAG: ribosome silencing factor [Candidatus Hydrogenedentes bacterium]|nr:ribosome silencing factor [Candidatus Hydrogenedentota bacterium]